MKTALSKVEKQVRDYYSKTYSAMKSNSKKRGHKPPNFSKEEFINWCANESGFDALFEQWVEANCPTELRPSIDRLSDNEGYSFGNMRITTWTLNHQKQILIRGKPITQLSLSGKLINRYASRGQAARSTGIRAGNIFRALNNGSTAGGFRWEYVNLEY